MSFAFHVYVPWGQHLFEAETSVPTSLFVGFMKQYAANFIFRHGLAIPAKGWKFDHCQYPWWKYVKTFISLSGTPTCCNKTWTIYLRRSQVSTQRKVALYLRTYLTDNNVLNFAWVENKLIFNLIRTSKLKTVQFTQNIHTKCSWFTQCISMSQTLPTQH